MSHQPSTVDQLKSTASSTLQTASETLDPNSKPDNPTQDYTQDLHGNTVKKGDLKHKLNEAALNAVREKDTSAPSEQGVVEKVLSYIPGFNSSETAKEEKPEVLPKTGPPSRPEHDTQVEEFLRGTYHSRSGDGMPNLDGK